MLIEGDNPQSTPQQHQEIPASTLTSTPTETSLEAQIAQLKREKERLLFGQQTGRIGTFEWDIASNTIIWTPELERLYGLPAGSFEGDYDSWAKRVHPDDLKRVEKHLWQVARGKIAYDTEFRVVWPDKSIHWLLAKGNLYVDERTPDARHMIGVNIDITERKEAEQVQEWQAALLKAAHDACIIKDPTGQILTWNEGATALYGWTEEEALGQKLASLLQVSFSRPREEILAELRVQHHWESELVHTRRDGSKITVASRWVLLQEAGDDGFILEVNRDITELKRMLENSHFMAEASKCLTDAQDYQEILAQVASLASLTVSDWCRIDILSEERQHQQLTTTPFEKVPASWQQSDTAKNEKDVALLAASTSALHIPIPASLFTTLAHNRQELAGIPAQRWTSAIEVPITLRGTMLGKLTLLTTDERRIYTQAELTMAEELARRAALAIEKTRIYQNLQDLNTNLEAIVEQRTATLRQSTETLSMLNQELERSNQELQDFAHVSSHDLQEPLRKIQAFGNLLETEYGAELKDGKFYLDRMRNAAERMQILINDLLTFARVTTKALPFTQVDLNVIAREVIEDLETRIATTGGRVEVAPLPTIEADPLQMRQMFQNTISNALKFHRSETPPLVKVFAQPLNDAGQETEPAHQFWQIYVEDNGIGFNEKYLDRIFIIFQQLHGKKEYSGTGIGLAIVRKIVTRHNGTITARSKPQEGSTFIITLPCYQHEKDDIPHDD